MDCYRDFAKIYDDLINEDIKYDEYGKTILNICEENHIKMNDYLDLACGTGNLTCEIIKSFRSTYGVDISEEMLMIAREKLIKAGYKPQFICQDIRDLTLNKKFDLITCALDGANYLIEDDSLGRFFKSVYSHLKDNGIFIFDINSYYKISEVLGNNIYNFDNDEVFYTWENTFEDDIVHMYLTFFIKNKEGMYQRFDEEHIERGYTEEEIEIALSENNLKVIKKLDNYHEENIKEDTQRIVYVVTK